MVTDLMRRTTSLMEKLQSEQIVRACWNAKKNIVHFTRGHHAVVALHREHDVISPSRLGIGMRETHPEI
jgi:hypothetical protein